MSPTLHKPVLAEEVLAWSNAKPGLIFVDGTVGGGGHASLLLERLVPGGKLLGFDRDPMALERARKVLIDASQRVAEKMRGEFHPKEEKDWFLIQGSYSQMEGPLQELHIEKVDGILLDLGLSSDQLADVDRGFSFREEGPLDLRFDRSTGEPAADFLQCAREEEIANVIYRYGEERFSRRIAKNIVAVRRSTPIRSTKQLVEIIHRSIPGPNHGRIDKATRTFQALRIAVNDELQHLSHALECLPKRLAPLGRLLVISFHSLEDRPVKNAFRDESLLKNLTKKPITASPLELQRNPRSRSAKLRVAERTVEPLQSSNT